MPLLHIANQEENTVFVRVIGEVQTEDVVDAINKFGKSPKIPNNFNVLIDLRQSKRSRDYDNAKRIVAAMASYPEKYSAKIVYLASGDVYFGASRMTATLAEMEGYDAHVTRSEEKACELLGVKSLPSDEQFATDGFEL